MKKLYFSKTLHIVITLGLMFFTSTVKAERVCIGNNYEIPSSLSNAVVPTVTILNAPTEIQERQTVSLSAEATVDVLNGGKAYFRWCTDKGYFEFDPNFPDYSTVTFVAPLVPEGNTPARIRVDVGDSLGNVQSHSVIINVLDTGNTEPNNPQPTVSIKTPTNFEVNSPFRVKFQMSDTDANGNDTTDLLNTDLYYSIDGGEFQEMVKGLRGNKSNYWWVPYIPSNNYRLKIVTTDGNTQTEQITETFLVLSDSPCKLYAVHDEGLNNSQIVVINIDEKLQVSALGNKHIGADIEALTRHDGKLFASSGDDTDKKGYLYRINTTNGQLIPKGSICFNNEQNTEVCGKEVSALTSHTDGTLLGWAEKNGLLTLNPDTGKGVLVLKNNLEIEDIASSSQFIYGIADKELWRYDGINAENICTLSRQVEAIEILPDDVRANYYDLPEGHDVLIYSFHNSRDFMIRAIDTNTCENIDEISIPTPGYNDIEGLVWVCK